MQLELPNSRTLPYYVISASFAAIVAMWMEVRRIEDACDLKLKEQRLQCDEAMKAQEARIDEARRELDRYKTEQAQLFQKTVLDIAFVIVFCFVGAFASRNNVTDLYIISIFGILGYLFERYKFPVAPLVLGAILGPHTETAFVTSMISFDNNWTVFFMRPISGVIMVLAIGGLLMSIFKKNTTNKGSTT